MLKLAMGTALLVTATAAAPAPASSTRPPVDFDFDMFELAPKEIQAPDDKTPKGGTPGKS